MREPGGMSRRSLLSRSGILLSATGLLAACTPGAPATSGGATTAPANAKPAASGGGKLQLPTFVPPKVAAPDVPGSETIPNGYTNYPKNPSQSVANPPGDGGEVNVAGEAFTPLIPL